MRSARANPARRDDRQGLAAKRAAATTAAGFVALGGALVSGASWPVAVLLAWEAAAALYLGLVWLTVGRLSDSRTAQLAGAEDASRTASDALLLGASVASLLAVGFVLERAGNADAGHRLALTALSVSSVLLAWATVHTVYALRYARLYYSPPPGGIDFQGEERPDYGDFAYLALTIGMTYQVSDTNISRRSIRRAA